MFAFDSRQSLANRWPRVMTLFTPRSVSESIHAQTQTNRLRASKRLRGTRRKEEADWPQHVDARGFTAIKVCFEHLQVCHSHPPAGPKRRSIAGPSCAARFSIV